MKIRATLASTVVAACLFSATSAKLSPARVPNAQANIALPRPDDVMSGSGVTISDVLGRDRDINIFAGFTRDIETVSKRLEGSQNTTLLAPLNSAITRLPRKPWEDPQEYAALGQNAYDGQSGEDRAHRNLRRFVEAHVVPESPWNEGKKVQTLGGDIVWWEQKDGKKMVLLIILCGMKHLLTSVRSNLEILKFLVSPTKLVMVRFGSWMELATMHSLVLL